MTDTKAVNLTEDEIKALVMTHAGEMDEDNLEDSLERMNYLNKRLKAFREVEVKDIEKTVTKQETGWPTNG